MGYTHYWRQKETLNQSDWALVVEDARAILEKTTVPLAWEYDESDRPPQIDGELVRFNGLGDDGHETLYLTRQRRDLYDYEKQFEDAKDGAFSFCKTAYKPYDVVVVAVLACLSDRFPEAFTVSSDGEEDEWLAGLILAREATERTIDVPPHVKDYE